MPDAIRASCLSRRCAVTIAGTVAGCAKPGESVQSALHPAGPAAEAIARLWWLMFWICTAIFILVVLLLVVGLIRRRRAAQPTPPLGNRFIVVTGIVMPAVVLVGLLIANLRASVALRSVEPALTIRVVGHQWWWEVIYPDGVIGANEIRIPVGRPVRLELGSADVIHSFWAPNLAGKVDMIPGMATTLDLRADSAGEYRAQCAEFCGLQHALMALYVVAMPPEQFDRWLAERKAPPAAPTDERLLRGQRVFSNAACGNCHTVRGTEFNGKIGPDLTHMGTRLTIGAGTVPNNRGNLAGWISNPQPLKPGNLMPPSYLSSDDLNAVTDYVESLK